MTDPPAIRMAELSAGDARALLEQFTAEGPARLDAFLASVRDLGGPAHALDGSLGSLEIVWPWFLEAATREQGPGLADGPWWGSFHPAWVRALGTQGAALATGLSEYLVSCIIALAPTSTWIVGRRASNRRHPVLEIPGRGEMDYAVPLGFVVRALSGDLPADREGRALRRLAEIWLGLDEEHEALIASLARPTPPWAVRAIDEGRFTHELSFEESVSHLRARRIAGLLDTLRGEQGIVEVVHEDRDVALIRAADLSADDVAAIVRRLWPAAGASHEDERSVVP